MIISILRRLLIDDKFNINLGLLLVFEYIISIIIKEK